MNLRKLFSQSEPSLAELQAAMDELGRREVEVRARRNELAEGRRELVKAGTAEELLASDKESADLDTELDQIAGKVPHLQRAIDVAESREAVGRATEMLRELPALAKAAAAAKARWLEERERLASAVAALETQREHAKREKFSPPRCTPKLFAQLTEVLDWLPTRNDRHAEVAAFNKPGRLTRRKATLLDEYPQDDYLPHMRPEANG